MIILDTKNYRLQYLCSLNDKSLPPQVGQLVFQGMKMNLEVVLAQPRLPVGQNQARGIQQMNGQWRASIRSKIILPMVTCSDSKITIYQLISFHKWIFWDPWAKKLRLLKKKQEFWMTRTFQGPRKSSLLARSESFRRGHEVIHFQGFIFHGYKK